MIRILIIVLLSLLGGCSKNAAEEARIQAIRNAEQVATQGFVDQNPVTSLYGALVDCDNVHEKCAALSKALQAFADGLASCSDGTKMCTTLRDFKDSGHPLIKRLPKPLQSVSMPKHPFYISLGNSLLDAQAPLFEYRTEIFWLWWSKYKNAVIVALLLIFASTVIRVNKRYLQKEEELERKRAQEKRQAEQIKATLIEASKRENAALEHQRILDQEQLEAELIAEQEHQVELDRLEEERLKEEQIQLEKKAALEKMKADIKAAMAPKKR